MKVLNLIQGSPEWHDHRAECLNASEAPIMAGASPYRTRTELIREHALGIEQEHDDATLARFAAGHASEAAARTIAEQIIGEELFPVTGEETIDGLRLSASSDGLNMDMTVGLEHKLWNEGVAEQVGSGTVPASHLPQLVHQALVFGLERILFMVSDGTPEKCVHCWYIPTDEDKRAILAKWKQFQEDVANYQHVEAKPEVTGRAPETLPALHVEVTGMVTSSNLLAFKETALAVFRGINTDLQTDADFADAEKTVKWCKDVEDRLEQTKQHALSQTASIDELFRTMDGIKEEAKAVRLKLDKLVKGEKENRKVEIVMQAQKAVADHVDALNLRIGGRWLSLPDMQQFATSIKGLKTLDSMRDKIGAALANAKIEASAMADRIEANQKSLNAPDRSWSFLFPDFGQMCAKEPEMFAALLRARIADHQERESAKMEAERARIRAEEQAKAEREAQAKARAEQDARDAETARQRALEQDRMRQEREAEQARIAAEQKEAIRVALSTERSNQAVRDAQSAIAQAQAPVLSDKHIADANAAAFVDSIPDNGATMKLGEICARLGFTLTAQFVADMGFPAIANEKNAKLYRASDFKRICAALVQHINRVTTE